MATDSGALVMALELIGHCSILVFFLASATARSHFPAFFGPDGFVFQTYRFPGHSADTKEQKQLKTGSNFFRVTQDISTCRFNHYDVMAQPSPAETMVQGKGDSVHSSCVE